MTESKTHSHSDLEQRVKKLEGDMKTLIHNLALINGANVEVMSQVIDFIGSQGVKNPDKLKEIILTNCDHDPPGCLKEHGKDKG